MRIVVIGAGAVGSFLGETLALAGHDVTLIRRRISGTGREELRLRDRDGMERTVDVATAGSAGDIAAAPDLVLLAVRMPDLAGALDAAAGWPEATVLAVQNGVGADDQIRAARPDGGMIAGSLTAAVSLDDGVIRRRSRGGIGLASVRGDVIATIEHLASAFAAGGLRVRIYPSAPAMRWSKLLANLQGNATSAILDLDPADVYANPKLFSIELRQLREALAVMRRLGLRPVALPGADVRLLGLAARLPAVLVRPVMRRVVAGGRGGKSPSLRTHLASGSGPTEVDWLNGAVARAAGATGAAAPTNTVLADLVRACSEDASRRAWFRERPDRLIEAVTGT